MAKSKGIYDYVWPLIHTGPKPRVMYSSDGKPCVYEAGQRVIPPKQLEFVHSMFKYKDTFYGGGAGGGKSTMLAWCFVIYLSWLAKNGFPGAIGGMFAETMDAVIQRQFNIAREKLYPSWLGDFIGGGGGLKNEFVAKDKFGGWKIQYRTTNGYEERERSTEYQIVGIDESTNVTEEAFRHIRSRGRGSHLGTFVPHVPILCASNPVGVGVAWHIDYFVKPWNPIKRTGRMPPCWIDVQGERQWYKGTNFIQSRIYDNPHLGPQDIITLQHLPPLQRMALLDGRWDVLQYQFIMLHPQVHRFPAGMRLPEEWPNYLAVDYAFNHTGAAYAARLGPGLKLWVHSGFEAKNLTPREFKLRMRETFRNPDGTPMHFESAVADRTMWPAENNTAAADFPIMVLNADDDLGSYNLHKARNGPKTLVPSWQALRGMADYEAEETVDPRTGERFTRVIRDSRLKIRENLTDLWSGFTVLERDHSDPDKPRKTRGDYGPGRGDDGPDCVRYIASEALEEFGDKDVYPEIAIRQKRTRIAFRDAPYA